MWNAHDDTSGAAEAPEAHWPHDAAHGGAAAMVCQVRALDVRDTIAIQDQLPRLGVSARVVWGTGDRFQKVGYGERLARDLSTVVVPIDGAKHFTPEDHPVPIADAINELIGIAGGAGPAPGAA